jgi:Holliday junction resolvase RusA-like endonuclease
MLSSNGINSQRSPAGSIDVAAMASETDPPCVTVISLPMPPTSNNLFAGSGKRRFRSKAYEEWILEAGLLLNRQRPPKIKGRVSILIEVEEPKTKRRSDVGNREKAAVDLLVSHGVIEGDDQFCVRQITLRWADVSGVRVTVERVL